ncbi:MAG: PDZ domain-containing protein [Bacteroidetes bacterium]|nr:PDZ domain-containing protein [Bacteroidota bacterium]
MKYIFSINEPNERFLAITMKIDIAKNTEFIELQLPSWRPGRYELGNFAKNIKAFEVFDSEGNPVVFSKSAKDCWRLKNANGLLTVKYKYFAAQLDAGACWLDRDQLYVNPIHCCMYVAGRENESCEVVLEIPNDWKIASGLKQSEKNVLYAENYEQLVDSPFIASPNLNHASYVLNGVTFNIWIQGICNPDWPKVISDFEEFTKVQLETMKEFPAKDFHFLIQVLPFPFYHGVEHLNSTVLAIGPGYNFMKPDLYNDLIGVASHELFHCWNVKSIRPIEMLPYNYTRENYSQSGFIYEGVTTYYGDLFLGRSGFFSFQQMLTEFSVRLQKHADNPGRYNYSVTESSFDTWLDGYVPGVPGRKVSIYDEGCLIALLLDFMIRSSTQSKKSLDQVMQLLYFDFGKKGKGYTSTDYKEIAEFVSGRSFDTFFAEHIFKASSLISLIGEVVSLAGIKIVQTPAVIAHEKLLGFRTDIKGLGNVVSAVFPGSPAHKSGLLKDDEIIAVNGTKVESNLLDLVNFSSDEKIEFTLFSNRKLCSLKMEKDTNQYYCKYSLESELELTASQVEFRHQWIKR